MITNNNIAVANYNFSDTAVPTSTKITNIFKNTLTSPLVVQDAKILTSLKTLTGWTLGCINGGLIPNIFVVNKIDASYCPVSNSNLPATITQFLAVNNNTMGVQSWITQKLSFTVGTFSLSFYVAGTNNRYNSNNTLSVVFNSTTDFLVSQYTPTTDNWTQLTYTIEVTKAGSYPITFIFNNNYTNSPNGYNSTICITNITCFKIVNGVVTTAALKIANFNFAAPAVSAAIKFKAIYANPNTSPYVQQATTLISGLKTVKGWTLGCVTGLLPNIFLVNILNTNYAPLSNADLPAAIKQFYSVDNNNRGLQSWITQSFTLLANTEYSLSVYVAYSNKYYNTNNTLSIAVKTTMLVSNYVPSAAKWNQITYTFTTTTAGSYPITFYFNNNYTNSPTGYTSSIGITNVSLSKVPPAANPYDVIIANSNFLSNVVAAKPGYNYFYQKTPAITGVLNLTTINGWKVGSINGLNPNILIVNVIDVNYAPSNIGLPAGLTQYYSVFNNSLGVQSWITQDVSFPVGTFTISFYASGGKQTYNTNNTLSVSVNGNSVASNIIASTSTWKNYKYTFTIDTAGIYPLTFYFNNNYDNNLKGYNSILNITGISIIGLSSPRNISFSNLTTTNATVNYTISNKSTITSDNAITYYATTTPSTDIFNSIGNSINLTGLRSNTNYNVQLYAKQSITDIQTASVFSSIKTPHEPPTTPANLYISNISAYGFNLSYTESITDGSGITYYASTSPTSSIFTSTSTTLALTDLSSNTIYTVYLYAKQMDISGLSSSTITITTTTLHAPPTEPSQLSITETTANTLTLSYTASTADASTGLVYYATTDPSSGVFSSTSTNLTITDLSSNKNYSVSLYAQIEDVQSTKATISGKTLNGPPTVPSGVSVFNKTNHDITLRYAASIADSINDTITYYATTTPTTNTFTSNTTDMYLTGLSEDTEYTISLYAKQNETNMDSSMVTITTNTLLNPPLPPSELTLGTTTNSSIEVSYTLSATENSSITYYAVTSPATSIFSSTTNTILLTDLSSYTTYDISVYAGNGLDSSMVTISQTTLHKPPTAPSQLSLSQITSSTMILTYLSSTGDSSSGITYYATTTPETTTFSSSTTSMELTELSSYTSYTVSLYAKQIDSDMDSSMVTIQGMTLHEPPTTPTNLYFSNITNTSLTLNYTSSTTDGSGLIYYVSTLPTTRIYSSTTNSITLTNLRSNFSYTVRLYAKQMDVDGLSSSRTTITGTTKYNKPTTPGRLNIANSSSSSISINYTPSIADISNITYIADTLPVSETFTSTTTQMNLNGLQSNTLYTIYLSSQIGDVNSDSTTISHKTDKGPPSIPTDLSINSITSSSMLLKYTKSNTDSEGSLKYFASTVPASNNFVCTDEDNISITGLESNTSYMIYLYSQQLNTGLKSSTATISATTPMNPPPVPTYLDIGKVTNTTIRLDYSLVTADISNITYIVTTTPATNTFTSTSNSILLTGLTSNTEYTLTLYTQIATTRSLTDATITAKTDYTVPNAPTNLIIDELTPDSLTLSYTGSTSDSSSGIITYNATTLPITSLFTSTSNTITLSNLTDNKTYTVFLYAKQSDSKLESSKVSIIITTLNKAPSIPTEVKLTNITSSSMYLSYKASQSKSNIPITYYATTEPPTNTYSTTGLFMTITDLSSNKFYKVIMYADQSSIVSPSVNVSDYTSHLNPSIPADLSLGIVTKSSIEITYSPSITDGIGLIYYATISPDTKTISTNGTNMVFNDLSSNTNYTISLYARQTDTGGLDSSSVTISALTLFEPSSTPTNLSLNNITSSSMVLSYTASKPQLNSTITYYATTIPATTTFTSNDTSMNITNLDYNTNYTIQLYSQQSNSGLNSATTTITGKTAHIPPSDPSNLSFGSITANSAMLYYTTSTPDSSDAYITYYATTTPATTTFTSNNASIRLTGLSSNTSYTVSLYAQQSDSGLNSSTVTVTSGLKTLHVPPSVPSNLFIGGISSSSMLLTYTASTTDGSGITYYATTTPASSTFTSNNTIMNLTGLLSNTSYTVTLYAQQNDVDGLSSSTATISGKKTSFGPPPVPSNLLFENITANSVKLNYTTSTADASDAYITYYATTTPATSTFTSNDASMNLTGLSSNTTYTVSIYARQSNSGLSSSNATSVIKTIHTPPSVPADLSFGTITSSSLLLTYTASITDGSGIIYYATTTPATSTFTSNSTIMNLTGLSSNTSYTVSLYAQQIDVSGFSSSTVTISGKTINGPPPVPSILSLVNITANSAKLNYTASTVDSSGAYLTYYATTTPATSTFTSNDTSMNLTGLSSNTSYTVTLYAKQSDSGLNSSNTTSVMKTLHVPPSTPSILSLVNITSSSMKLSYTASTTDGSGITYYATTIPATSTFTSNDTSMNLTGLSSNTSYTVSLYAQQTDISGLSSSTVSTTGKTIHAAPSAPSNLSLGNFSSSSMSLSYTASTTDGSGIIYYATTTPATSTFTSNDTSMNLTGLADGTSYTVSIYAQQTDISGLSSSTVSITGSTLIAYLSPPTNLSLGSFTATSMTLSYTASSGTGITYYATTSVSGTNLISNFALNTDSALSLRYPLNGSLLNYASTVGVTDASFVVSGTASYSVTQSKFGGYSMASNFTNPGVSLSLSNPNISTNNGYTISIWVYFNTNTSDQNLLSFFFTKNSDQTAYDIAFILVKSNHANTNIRNKIYFKPYKPGDSTLGFFTNNALTNNAWNHIAVSIATSGQCKFYINGSLDTTSTSANILYLNNVTFKKVDLMRSTGGYVNDLRYYNRVLSDAEVTSLKNYNYTNDYIATFLGNNTSTTTSVSIPGLIIGPSYNVLIYAKDNNSGVQSSVETISATIPFSPPSNLSLGSITATSMTLSYTASIGTNNTYYVTTNASGTNLISNFALNTDSALKLRCPLNGSVLNFASTVGVSNASIGGTASLSTAKSIFGGYSFYNNGGAGYVSIVYSYTFNTSINTTNGYTISAWVYPISYTGQIFNFQFGPTINYVVYCQLNANGTIYFNTIGGTSPSFNTTGTIPLNTWSHVAVTMTTGNQCKFYINGTSNVTSSSLFITTGLTLNNSTLFYNLNGYANDLRYYNRVLSDAEISSLKNYTITNDYIATFLGNNTSTTTSVSIPGLIAGTTFNHSIYAKNNSGAQSVPASISGSTITELVAKTQFTFPNSSINYGLVLSNLTMSPANSSYPYYNASNVSQQKLTITGQSNSYLNGNYYATASAWDFAAIYNVYYSPDRLFTDTATSNYGDIAFFIGPTSGSISWYDSSGILRTTGYPQDPYNSTSPYAYRGGGSSQYYYTTTAGGTGYNGEWVQIGFPFSFLVTSITIRSRGYNQNGFQRDITLGYLLGSNDSSTWTLLYTINQATKQASYTYNTGLSNTYSNTYKYFRLVQNRCFGVTPNMNFSQWYLTGYPYA